MLGRAGAYGTSLSPRLDAGDEPAMLLTGRQARTRARVLQALHDGTYATEEVPCFCGVSGGVTVARRDRYGLPVTTLLCTSCGLLRSSPRMDASATERFYRDDYRALYRGSAGIGSRFQFQVVRGERFLGELWPHLGAVRRIYEVGCGAGGVLLPFAQAGFEVAGCDYDRVHLELGRAHGLNLVEGDVEALMTAQGARADLVVLSHVMEHFLDLRRDLAAVLRAIRPGGLLMVEVPGIFSITNDYYGDLLRYLQNAHNYHFTAPTLVNVCASAGLDLLRADERVWALFRRPARLEPRYELPPPRGEARRVLRFLAGLERRVLRPASAPPPQASMAHQLPALG